MPAKLHAGIYWGFLEMFRWNTAIEAELAFSRDGTDFQRLPTRGKLLPLGPEGSWDDGMILAPTGWVEVGDEWWLYYSGWDGPHGAKEQEQAGRLRIGNIGLAKVRKEGFISMRGPADGGVITTRRIRWPGGRLLINADARRGEMRVRIVDESRKPIPGFDYSDVTPFSGDAIAYEPKWSGGSVDALRDRVVRLEFFLRNADLYTFRASE
jgi:hypothetical protein